jgi:two-component system chemotaxis response regulator CheB
MAACRHVVVGASSGGLDALRRLLRGLPGDFGASLTVLLHTASDETDGLCEVLGRWSALPVGEAREREPVCPSRVYVAPPGYHLLIERDGRFALSMDEKVCFVRPSADVLFESAAEAWGDALVGVVLTGANEDGARGLAAVRRLGGRAVVQHPEDAEFAAMPVAALQSAGADWVVPADRIGLLLARLAVPAATE